MEYNLDMTNTTNLLKPPATASRQLTWYPPEYSYVGEVSSTNGFGRVFKDAVDEGLTLVSRTGEEVTFVVSHTEVRDGEVIYWDLAPLNSKHTFKVRLFND